MIDKILEHNEEFVNKEKYKPYEASKYPSPKASDCYLYGHPSD